MFYAYTRRKSKIFFYEIDLDDEGCEKCFLGGCKCRNDYQEFGDLVSFETTYIMIEVQPARLMILYKDCRSYDKVQD